MQPEDREPLHVVAAKLGDDVHQPGHHRQADGCGHHDYDDLQRIDDNAQDTTDGVSDRFGDSQGDDDGHDYYRASSTTHAGMRVGS